MVSNLLYSLLLRGEAMNNNLNNLSKYDNSLGTAVSGKFFTCYRIRGYGIIHVVVVILLVSDRDQDVETAPGVG